MTIRTATEGAALEVNLILGTYPDIEHRYTWQTNLGFAALGDGTPNVVSWTNDAEVNSDIDLGTGEVIWYVGPKCYSLSLNREDWAYARLEFEPKPDSQVQVPVDAVVSHGKMWNSAVDYLSDSYRLRCCAVTDLVDSTIGDTLFTQPDDFGLTQTFALGIGSFDGYAGGGQARSPNSTTSAPKMIQMFGPYTLAQSEWLVWAIEEDATGTATIYNHFKLPVDSNWVHLASCSDAGNMWHVMLIAGVPSVVRATLQTFVSGGGGTWDYDVYTAALDDATIQAIIEGTTSRWRVIGTDSGFVLTYLDGSDLGQTLLVSKDWTTFQRVTFTTANATVQEMLDNYGLDRFADFSFSNVTVARDGTWYFTAYPMLPETEEGLPPTPTVVAYSDPGAGGVTDEDITLRVWGFSLDNHDFAVFRLGTTETLVFDLTTKQWSHWSTPLLDYWRAHVGQNWVGATGSVTNGTDIVAGDDTEGVLYILDPVAGMDDDPVTGEAATFTRRVTGSVDLRSRNSAPCNAVQLTVNLGAPALTGARFTLRTSDDVGQTWNSHGTVTVTAGNFSQVVEWRALGLMRQPGRLFSFEDDGAAIRISGAHLR